MPDLTLSFINPKLLDDVSFHPCVRFKKWKFEKILSFIPPDGNFRLMSYHVEPQNIVAIPIYVKHNINFREQTSGKFHVTVEPKQTIGRVVENVVLMISMPKFVVNCIVLQLIRARTRLIPLQKFCNGTSVGSISQNCQI